MADRIQLENRAIIGSIMHNVGTVQLAWVQAVGMKFESDQASEKYGWLGQTPSMQRRTGDLQGKRLNPNVYEIANEKYEATLIVSGDEKRRDKTGQVQIRIGQLGGASDKHWASLYSTLLLNGASSVCYDGDYFFGTAHVEGENQTAQSNSISVDISALPCQVHGVVTAPSSEEAQQAALLGVSQILSFKDDKGELFNEGASNFLIVCGVGLFAYLATGIGATEIANTTNIITTGKLGFNITIMHNARLNAWTDKFVVLRTDGDVKALIGQEEFLEPKVLGFDSEHFDKTDEAIFAIVASRGAGYGFWQMAVLVTLI